MTLTKDWLDLARTRFADLPLDCGNDHDPGIIYSEDLRDWSDKATTPDQVRMEHYIDRYDLRNARVLHVGIGNSGFAKRFAKRVREIVGTTVDLPEIDVANALSIPNYRTVIHNKYSGSDDRIQGPFDIILDNNPTSPCCCLRHLSDMLECYAQLLAPGGQIVTDKVGLGWVPDITHRRWRFDFDDLSAIGQAEGLQAFRASPKVFVLARSTPLVPGLPSRLRHVARRASALPGRVMRRLANAGSRALAAKANQRAKR